MGHLVHAATQLISEVSDLVPNAKVEVLPEEDGLGFNRSIRFDSDAKEALGDTVIEALETDERIEQVVKSNKGLRVTFVAGVEADHNDSFGISDAVAVATEG